MDWSLKLLKSWQWIGHVLLWDQLQIQAAHGEKQTFGYSEFIGMGMVDTKKWVVCHEEETSETLWQ